MKPFFWIDLEMTGLDEHVHTIMEVAVAVTNLELEVIDEYQQIALLSNEEIAKMDPWCQKTHGQSGLSEAVKTGTPLAKIEEDLLVLADRHYPRGERIILAGNSVGNDRRFIDKYMPEFSKRLHYRLIDVSSFKEVFREKYGVVVQKQNAHRALDDIRESIKELSTYLSYVSVPKKTVTPAAGAMPNSSSRGQKSES